MQNKKLLQGLLFGASGIACFAAYALAQTTVPAAPVPAVSSPAAPATPATGALMELPSPPTPAAAPVTPPSVPAPAISLAATPANNPTPPPAPPPAITPSAVNALPMPATTPATITPATAPATSSNAVPAIPVAITPLSSAVTPPPPTIVAPATPTVVPTPNPSSATTPAVAAPIPAPVAQSPAAVDTPLLATIPTSANVLKNGDILLMPLHVGETSLMFSKEDLHVIEQGIALYDNSARPKTVNGDTNNKDDLTSLLQSLGTHTEATPEAAAPLPLPNLYLGSIVYYSPSYWSVWVNGRKLLNTHNAPGNALFVSRLSRTEVELIWTPPSLLDAPAVWKQLTNNGANPLPNVKVDESKGKITLHMRPNQTFLPRSLAIREGFIKSNIPAPATPVKQ